MGFFFRRSTHLGPFRLNFSKSGVGASVGVKGARLTMTPRGTTYVTVGSHGFYYRETLSHRAGSPTPTPAGPAILPPEAHTSDDIATADVSELVDSTSEALIRRLNERAKMSNPAWVLYAIAAVACVSGLTMLAPAQGSQATPNLPEVTSPQSLVRKSNTRDEYSMLVVRYGEPSSVLITDPLGIVPVRSAHYSSASVSVFLVPNGCTDAYEYEEARRSAARSARPAMITSEMRRIQCVPLPGDGWTIVAYADSSDNSAISASTAKALLDAIAFRLSSPPAVVVEKTAGKKDKASSRTLANQPPELKPEIQPNKQALLAEEQMSENANAAKGRVPYPGLALLFGSGGLVFAGIVVHKKNTEKRTSRLFYELDKTEAQKFSIVQQAHAYLAESHRVWRIEGQAATSDWKRNAGASTLMRRVAVSVGRSNPPRVESNLAIPCINLAQARLFFLPDFVLYWERGTYGAISYDDFRVEQTFTTFIEDGPVPADATVVDRTWRYVNKSGGPDRRFNNNAQLPVVRYGVLVLTSSRGLNIHLNTSNAQSSLAAARCWHERNGRVGNRQEPQSAVPSRPDTPSGPEAQALKLLGVTTNASPGEISAAYHHLAQMYHPDKVAGLAPEFQTLADLRMKEINAAYQLLKGRGSPAQTT